MTPEEILAEAARLVERGWCQGTYRDTDGRVCLVGALNEASGRPCTYLDEAWNAVCLEIPQGPSDWNDTPGRTAEEVATALRNAKRWL